MLSINIDQVELFNEQTNEFFYLKPIVLKLEHSLISISKWEAKWHKPFADSQKTDAEMRDYIRCMTLNGDLHPAYYSKLSKEDITKIENYINDEMTATTFRINGQQKGRVPSKKIITSELIYYWMITLNIPFECENLHDYLFIPYSEAGGNGSAAKVMKDVDNLPVHKTGYKSKER